MHPINISFLCIHNGGDDRLWHNSILLTFLPLSRLWDVNEFGQKILQSHTADQPMAHEEETQNTNSHQAAGGRKLFFLGEMIAKLEMPQRIA